MQGLPKIGDVLDETYRIEAELGKGGFGAVYLARQISMDRQVAIKILVASALRVDEMIQRFRREVMAIRNLGHPNTIRVYDFRDRADGILYYAMEYVKGPTLKDVIAEGPMSPDRARHILRQILKSLAEAHNLGIVHRDLKPANIMLAEMHGETDFVKVLDFGIAKIVDGDGEDDDRDQITNAGVLVGTLSYMSPEQIAGGKITPSSDLYALGLIGVELLTGASVFEGTGRWEILHKQISEDPVEIPHAVLESPLGPVLQAALHKRQPDRYQSAEEMLAAFEATSKAKQGPLIIGTAAKSERKNAAASPATTSLEEPQTEADEEPPAPVPAAPVAATARKVRTPASVSTADDAGEDFHDEKTQTVDSTPSVVSPFASVSSDLADVSPSAAPRASAFAAEPAPPPTQAITGEHEFNGPSSKKPLIVVLVVLVIAALGATAALIGVSGDTPAEPAVAEAAPVPAPVAELLPEPEVAEPEVAEPAVAEPDPQVGEPAVETRQIRLRSPGVSAAVFDGDRLIGDTPIRFQVGEEKAYTLVAEGFEDATVVLSHASEPTVTVKMKALPSAKKTEPAKREPQPDKPPRKVEAAAPASAEPRAAKKPAEEPAAAKEELDWVPIVPTKKKASPPPRKNEVPVF